LTQVGDGARYSCYPELPWRDAGEVSLRGLLGLPDRLFLAIIATCSVGPIGSAMEFGLLARRDLPADS